MNTRKIRLLLVNSVFVDRGVERILIFLYKFLPEHMYEVKLLSLRSLSPFADYLNRNTDIKVDVIGMKNNFDILSLFKYYRYLKEFKPDIINFHTFRAALWGRPLAKLANVPVILYSVHNKWGGTLHYFLDRKMARFTDAIIPFSIAVRNFLLYEEKINDKHVKRPIYIGIDINKFSIINNHEVDHLRKELDISIGQNVIGFVGNISSQKGLPCLVEAVKNLQSAFPDICCLIIGEGPEEDNLKKMIKEYKVDNNFKFLGQRYDVQNLLHLMKILVLPSLWEGLPQVVIEAMAASCPVVATSVDGTIEIITHMKDGWLVQPNNSEELTYAIKTLLTDNTLREELSGNGYKTVKDKFSVEAMVENYHNLYQSYLDKLL